MQSLDVQETIMRPLSQMIDVEAAAAPAIDEQSLHPSSIQRKKTVAAVVATVLTAVAIVIGVVLLARPHQPVRAAGALHGIQDVVGSSSVASNANQNQNLAETDGNITEGDSVDYCSNPNEGLCNVQFDTDNYPWENEWTLKDALGNVVMSGPPEGQNYDRSTRYVKSMCVATGTYTFALTDKYKDGVCCEYGEGSMVVKVNGEVVASTGESSFEKFERTITVQQSSSTTESSTDGYNHVTAYCQAACNDNGICTYTALVDMFASEFGFFHFKECPDAGNMPTITMELGKTYRFVQRDISNYIHPLGFAYEPDGALADADEVEEEYLSYQLNGEDIGLDGYEPNFAHPIDEWATDGEYYVEVTIPQDFTYTKDLFYFCHIHRYLGGRIKLRRNGTLIQPSHLPIHNTMPPPPSSYDKQCGTYGLVHQYAELGQMGDSWTHSMAADYRLPHSECPLTFVCEDGKSIFASCLDAINCHMFIGMTTYEQYSEVALFLQQMIPHHQNAVNMAKSLLLNWSYTCDPADLGSDSAECLMENILRSIVYGQNAQIQTMRDLLERNGWPEFDHCDRPIQGSSEDEEMDSEYENIDNSRYDPGERHLHVEASDEKEYYNDGRGLAEDGTCRGSCSSENGEEVCVFTMGVDIFASDLGAFYFEECGSDNIYPIIGVEIGKTYRFVQEDRSNYYHPLGFAYHPDGAHVDKQEVEEIYLTYKLNANIVGLDGYEPLFFHSAAEWTDYGTFTVELKYDKDYDQDLFYFCHVHSKMSGRIKLLKNGQPVQTANLPEISYSHPEPSEYDRSCGTYGLELFQLPHPECAQEYVCNKRSKFASCLETMNCYMMVGMTTGGNQGDVALFNHQMIPHHINAVNMAKALLKTEVLQCSNLAAETDDCIMESILWDIVGNQNYQIQQMYDVLSQEMKDTTNDCVIAIHSDELRI